MDILYILRKICNSCKCLYTTYGIHKRGHVQIRPCVFFDRPKFIYIGNNSLINYGCSFYVGYGKNTKIVIGNNVFIGMSCTFTCVSHIIGNSERRAGATTYKDIMVEDGCWIGASSTILQGVTIAKGCIIAAGSLVNKSEPNGLYAGVPAKRIKDL